MITSTEKKAQSAFDLSDLDSDPLADTANSSFKAEQIRENAHIANGGESATVECPRCKGSGLWRGHTRSFPCRGCDGKGKTTTRKAGAYKGQQTRQANIEAWQEEHADLIAELRRISEWNDFARKSLESIAEYGTLREERVAALRSMLAKLNANREVRREQRKAESVARGGEVGVDRINALFSTALASGLKKPMFRTEHLVIKPAKKDAAILYVTDRRVHDPINGGPGYVGKIVNGKFEARREAKPDTLQLLCDIAENPLEAATKYGRSTGNCCCCGRELTDPESVAAGIGPICVTKWGM